MLSVFMLSVFMLSVVMLSVAAPIGFCECYKTICLVTNKLECFVSEHLILLNSMTDLIRLTWGHLQMFCVGNLLSSHYGPHYKHVYNCNWWLVKHISLLNEASRARLKLCCHSRVVNYKCIMFILLATTHFFTPSITEKKKFYNMNTSGQFHKILRV
jgi:hypothetical protein